MDGHPADKSEPLDRIDTLTATVDQLQAHVDQHEIALALLLGCAFGTCILLVMFEVKLRRLYSGD